MRSEEEIHTTEICECGEKNVAEAIEIFQNTTLPFKKAKKLVTGCNKNCCRAALSKLFDMNEFGQIDLHEIDHLIQKRLERLKKLAEGDA